MPRLRAARGGTFCKVCFAFCYFMTNSHFLLVTPHQHIFAHLSIPISPHFAVKNNRHKINNVSIISVYSPRYNVLFYSLSSSALPSVSGCAVRLRFSVSIAITHSGQYIRVAVTLRPLPYGL